MSGVNFCGKHVREREVGLYQPEQCRGEHEGRRGQGQSPHYPPFNQTIEEVAREKTQNAKNHRKSQRISKEIEILKGCEKDDLAKFAIASKKSLAKVMDNVDDLKGRALARISAHSAVKNKVAEFRSRYPDWEENIQSLMAKMGRKRA